MPEPAYTPPVWAEFAHRVIAKLRRHHGIAGSPTADMHDKMASLSELDELFARFDDGKNSGLFEVPSGRPSRYVPARQLMTAIRLAAAFGGSEAYDASLLFGAVTVISDIAPADMTIVRDVLKLCFPDSDWQIVSPDIVDSNVTKNAQGRFDAAIAERIDCIEPVLILQARGVSLPRHLRAVALPTLPLVAVSRDIVMTHLLSGSLSDQIDDAGALRASLPDDATLARFETIEVCAALRAPNLPAAVARLNAMAGQQATEQGPRLEDMPGDSAALRAARRMVTDLRLWQRGDVGWHEISRSLLLYGPPGTGKTYLARAMGRSADLAFVTATFAEWQAAGHLGHMLREMRATFAEARQRAPSILFIDEIDAVGSRTDGDGHAVNYRTQVINAFLGEMNEVAAQEGVIVVGACNDPERIDPAVLRAGRFDLKIAVPLPDGDMLLAILCQRLRAEISGDALQVLARLAVGRSLADLDAAIRAARSDARHGGGALRMEMIATHLGVSTEAEDHDYLWRIAVHEAGHALIGAALDLGASHRMWISREGGQISRKAIPNQSRLSDIEAEISYLLGGRAAERLILGEVSAGAGGPASSDLAAATRHAIMIETSYGLGVEGPVWHADPEAVHLRTPAIRDRVRLRLQKAEQQAGKVLMQHQATLEGLARELLHKRSMGAAEIARWLREVRPLPDLPTATASGPTSRELASPA